MLNRRRLLIAGAGLLLVLAFGWLGRNWLLPPLASWLDVGQAPHRVTAVMPLPGDENRRPFVAAAWVRVGLASSMLINQNADSPDIEDGIKPPTHEVIRKVAEVRGVSSPQIEMLVGDSTSTADDLNQLAVYMAEHPQATVAVVTSGFHTRRTRWTIRHRMPQYADRIIFVSAPNPGFETRRWWWTDDGRRLIISEYLKLGFYQLRYNAGWLLLTVVGAAVILLCRTRWRSQAKLGPIE